VVGCLPSKYKTLSSDHTSSKQNKTIYFKIIVDLHAVRKNTQIPYVLLRQVIQLLTQHILYGNSLEFSVSFFLFSFSKCYSSHCHHCNALLLWNHNQCPNLAALANFGHKSTVSLLILNEA
jgi:hypothetical protein